MPHCLVLDHHRVLASKELHDVLCVLQGSDGSAHPWDGKPSDIRLGKDSGDQGNILTVFPMTMIQLLKALRLKAGKGLMERTGHLGIVDLISTIHVSG